VPNMNLSELGRAVLKQEEGDVLRAYRDVAGVWTISAGLTAKSGVIRPKAGMTITQKDSDRLIDMALQRNYLPAVNTAMAPGKPNQHEFDAGVLFHWNTGAIRGASWVRNWIRRDWQAVEVAFKAWNKAGGKRNAVLVARRDREFAILKSGTYPALARPARISLDIARVVSPVREVQIEELRGALAHLGYPVGSDPRRIRAAAVRQFQSDHGLTPDGIIGRATASTIQRRLDAASKAKGAAVVNVGTAGTGAADYLSGGSPDLWLSGLLIVAGAAYLIWTAWSYRDAIAVKLNSRAPRLAAWLRSR